MWQSRYFGLPEWFRSEGNADIHPFEKLSPLLRCSIGNLSQGLQGCAGGSQERSRSSPRLFCHSLFPSGGQGLGDKLQDKLQTSFMLPNSCIPQVFFKDKISAHSDCGPFGVIYLCSFSVLLHPLWSNSSGFGKDELIPSAGKDIFPGKPHFGSTSLPLTSLGEPGELTGRSWG